MIMLIGDKVRLISFNGQDTCPPNIEKKENYWKLIGKTGVIVQDPNERNLYASFSKEKRLLIKFNEDVEKHGLNCHNSIKNALWILQTDLKEIKSST
jgi:hypothetical protein